MLFHPSVQAREILKFLVRRHILGQECLISSLSKDQETWEWLSQLTWGAWPACDRVVCIVFQMLRMSVHVFCFFFGGGDMPLFI